MSNLEMSHADFGNAPVAGNPVGRFTLGRLLVGTTLAASVLLGGCFEAPPIDSDQIGYRGVGMQTIDNPDLVSPKKLANLLPAPLPAVAATPGGPTASDVYQNVPVLGHLPIAEFTRTMASITAWVSPEAGCSYCHVGNNFASDAIYTKVVSRRMMQMTMDINSNWSSHVKQTGVTCLTCHRGKPVPEYVWFDQPPVNREGGMAPRNYSQNHVNEDIGYTSMASDVFERYLEGDVANQDNRIRVIAKNALPIRNVTSNQATQDTENTYSLMIHMSESLGVNCTYCHNTRYFGSWEQSPPTRVTAYHGLKMVPSLNETYLKPLGPVYPESRLGPAVATEAVNAPKVNCTTCHQNVAKPFYGVSMLDDYPVWRGKDYEGPPLRTPIDPMNEMPSAAGEEDAVPDSARHDDEAPLDPSAAPLLPGERERAALELDRRFDLLGR